MHVLIPDSVVDGEHEELINQTQNLLNRIAEMIDSHLLAFLGVFCELGSSTRCPTEIRISGTARTTGQRNCHEEIPP
jgi:hypothetical protein